MSIWLKSESVFEMVFEVWRSIMSDKFIKWVLVLAAAVLVLGAGIGGFLITKNVQQVQLTFVAVFGVILLLATITIVAVSFALLKMNDNTQALALPEGSVRAIIALSMLVIFLMLSVFLYSDQAANSRPQTLNGLTQKELDAIPPDEIIAGPTPAGGPSFSVTILPRNPVSADFAKQIFTSISTMVISIAAFYFGTRAVASARSSVATSQPEVTDVIPAKIELGKSPQDLTIHGTGFDNPSVVKFVKDGRSLNVRDITSNPTRILGTVLDLTTDDIGHWSCIVVNSDGGTAAPLHNALEVPAPLGSPP
jgi:hypothetical protein